MSVKFDVKMTKEAMFDFMLYTSLTSITGILGIVAGGLLLMVGIKQLLAGEIGRAATYFMFAAIFLVINPVNMKIRAGEQVKRTPMFQKPLTYELDENGVKVTQDDQSAENSWDDFRKVISTNKSIIMFVTKKRAIIFPKESLGEQYAEVVRVISAHVPAKKVNIRHVSAS